MNPTTEMWADIAGGHGVLGSITVILLLVLCGVRSSSLSDTINRCNPSKVKVRNLSVYVYVCA